MPISEKRRKNLLKPGVLRKWKTPEWITAGCVLFIRLLFYLCVNIPQLEEDTHTYVDFSWRDFLAGERMPLYPVLLQINRFFFHDGYLVGIVGCQIVVSMFAVFYLYRTVCITTKNRGIACAVAFFYGGNPWILHFDTQILTESFAISLSVFLLYHTVCYIHSRSLCSGSAMVFCVILSVLLKSAMFVYVPVYLIFMVMQFFDSRKGRKTVLKLSAILLGAVFLLLIYAGQVWQHSGTFFIDKRGPRNMLIACLETGLYQNYPDQELVERIDKIYLKNQKSIRWETTLKPILLMFGDSEKEYNIKIHKFNLYCIRSDYRVYLKYLLQRFIRVTNREYGLEPPDVDVRSPMFSVIYQMQEILFPSMRIGHIYLIDGTFFLLMIRKWRKSGSCPWYYLGTWGVILVILVSVFIGVSDSYLRCTSYVLPFAFFGLALLLSDLCNGIQKYKTES